jgi:hypothetical protein
MAGGVPSEWGMGICEGAGSGLESITVSCLPGDEWANSIYNWQGPGYFSSDNAQYFNPNQSSSFGTWTVTTQSSPSPVPAATPFVLIVTAIALFGILWRRKAY